MIFLKKLSYLFLEAWRSARLIASVNAYPTPGWVESVNLRDGLPGKGPKLTIAQLHAELTKAIDAGHGHRTLAVEVAYLEGLLCGSPRVAVSGVALQAPKGSVRGEPYLYLETEQSVVMLGSRTFEAAMKYNDAQGPIS